MLCDFSLLPKQQQGTRAQIHLSPSAFSDDCIWLGVSVAAAEAVASEEVLTVFSEVIDAAVWNSWELSEKWLYYYTIRG